MNKLFLLSLTTLGLLTCLRCEAWIPLFRSSRRQARRAPPGDH